MVFIGRPNFQRYSSIMFDSAIFWRTLVRAVFSEIGDKTFFLAMLLSAWCPFGGLRTSGRVTLQRMLVMLGAILALLLWTLLISVGVSRHWCGFAFNIASCVGFTLMGMKALIEMVGRDSPEAKTIADEENSANPFSSATDSFDSTAGPTEQKLHKAYGSLPEEEHAHSTEGCALFLSWAVPFVFGIIAESEDKSAVALIEGASMGADTVLGAMIGYIPVILFAVFIGTLLERSFVQSRMLFVVGLGFLVLSFVCLSQALVKMQFLQTFRFRPRS